MLFRATEAARASPADTALVRQPTRRLVFAPGTDIGHEPYPDKNSKMLILDLLCACIRAHTYRFKYFALRNNLCVKVRCYPLVSRTLCHGSTP